MHEIAQSALRLLDDELDVPAMPLVRLAYEGAITAQWVAQADDGAEAFFKEEQRSLKATARDLVKAPSIVMQEVGAGMLAKDQASEYDTSSEQQARYVRQRCLDLTPGGLELYAYYRVLCLGSHASPHVVDRYVVPNEDRTNVERVTKLANAEEGGSAWLHYMLTLSVVLAAARSTIRTPPSAAGASCARLPKP